MHFKWSFELKTNPTIMLLYCSSVAKVSEEIFFNWRWKKLHTITLTLWPWNSVVNTVDYWQTNNFTKQFHPLSNTSDNIYMIVQVNLNICKKSPVNWYDVPFKFKEFSSFDVLFCHALLTINVVSTILVTGTLKSV